MVVVSASMYLGSQEHGGAAHQLQFASTDLLLAQEAVDEVHGEVQGFPAEFELDVNFHKPVNQDLYASIAISPEQQTTANKPKMSHTRLPLSSWR